MHSSTITDDMDLFDSYVGTMEDIERELASQAPAPVELNPEALAEIAELMASFAPVPDLKGGTCTTGEYHPDLWFEEDAKSKTKAKALCLSCPVRTLCATVDDNHGIWGGEERPRWQCKAGHTGNTYKDSDGWLRCATCRSERRREQRARKKVA